MLLGSFAASISVECVGSSVLKTRNGYVQWWFNIQNGELPTTSVRFNGTPITLRNRGISLARRPDHLLRFDLWTKIGPNAV